MTAKTGQGRKAQLTLSQEVEFKRLFELKQAESEGGSLTGYDACLLLAAHFTPLSQSSAYRLLHKVGLSWITGRDIHPKHNAEAQADFKKNFIDTVVQSIPKNIELKQVDVWFQDEARVGQRGTTSRVWAAKGTRPRLIRQQQFNYAHVFGAICPATGEAVGLVMPKMNTEAMQHHLTEIAKHIAEGRHAVVVMDRAPWHMTKKISLPDNLSIIPLPSTSPELNPVEQVWAWLRRHYWSNRQLLDYNAIVDAACDAWVNFANNPKNVSSIGTRSWACLYP